MYENADWNYRSWRGGRAYKELRTQLKAAGPNICCLCGRAIDLGLPPRHPDSWTLDHVVPTSLGGDPLDPANAREAHSSCNSARQNRTTIDKPINSQPW